MHPAIHTHRLIKRLESLKNQHQNPQTNSYFHSQSGKKMGGKRCCCLSLLAVQQDNSQCLQVVGRT